MPGKSCDHLKILMMTCLPASLLQDDLLQFRDIVEVEAMMRAKKSGNEFEKRTLHLCLPAQGVPHCQAYRTLLSLL